MSLSFVLDQHKTALLKETKSLYEKELDEYQKDLELAVRERDELEEKLKEKEILLESVGKEFEGYMAKLQAEGSIVSLSSSSSIE